MPNTSLSFARLAALTVVLAGVAAGMPAAFAQSSVQPAAPQLTPALQQEWQEIQTYHGSVPLSSELRDGAGQTLDPSTGTPLPGHADNNN
jgi:hypothetical protein